ncbi:aminopeptidase [Deinococcus roseus]|uniref:Aminopeptidase n=1 Tax=Deinococcus roseus TaxID=392414 RepID=A0ABQ2CVN3_9DEIO|nr:aminopeptidase [Deinococcus roseus]GGJ25100.1 aminopeptidase [Deinococcus roseus]
MLQELAEKQARLLAAYCIHAQENETILIQGSTHALPVLEALHREILQRGARPLLKLEFPYQLAEFVNLASDAVLDALAPGAVQEMEGIAGSIRIDAPMPPRKGADPARMQRWGKTLNPLGEIRRQKKWCISLFPTEYAAQSAGMSFEDYQQFVLQAMFLDHADPVQKWGEVRERQTTLIERLSKASEIRILSENTDLTLNVKDRIWANSDGKRNMPSGEVFTGPIETSASGHIFYDLPTLYQGREVQGIHLTFEEGKVVQAHADVGNDVLQAALSTDPGARFLGEIGIGTNYGIQTPSKNILFDEKIGGTVHLAVGSSYPETGGLNKSTIHWDMICDLRSGGEILLDGEVFQRDGVFV